MYHKILPIDQIVIPPYNPNTMDAREFQKLMRSIQTFGYIEPVIINSVTGHVVGGSHRVLALRELGYTEIETIQVELPLEQEKLLNLALNKIHGTPDEILLAKLLSELKQMPQLDVTCSGFDVPEISEILDAQRMPVVEDDFDVDASLASIEEPVTQRGDLIELGEHRVLCGDSANPNDLKTLIGENKVNLLDCDFPYNVNYMGGDRPNPNTRPKDSRKWDRIYSDDMPQEEYEEWMRKILTKVREYLNPGAAIYIWQGHRQFPPLYQILLDLNFHVACIVAWIKECAAISYADYSFQSEQCLYGWLNGAPHYFAGEPGESNVWQIKRDPTKTYQHPTQKPVALRQRSVKNSSKIGDIVLDTFLGSGSILLACEALGRRCFGLEIDPKYCDVVVCRYLNFVGREKVSADLWNKYMAGGSNGK